MKCIVMLLAAMALTGRAADIYVAPGGLDGNGGTGWTDALATIGAGVAKATGTGPHTVYVSNGTYTISSEIALTNTVTVQSWNAGALDPVGTIVDGNAVTRGFKLTHAGAVLAGVTVRNGTNDTSGGGVYVTGGGMVTQCVLSGNSARLGAGLYLSRGLVTDSTIRGNVAFTNSAEPSRGAGAYLVYSGVVTRCVVADNTVASRYYDHSPSYDYSGGGGLFLYLSSTTHLCRVYDSLIVSNVSQFSGGGMLIWQNFNGITQAIVSGSTVSHNSAGTFYNATGNDGGGVYSVYGKPGGLLTGCLIEKNVAAYGGGGVSSFQGITARDCTLRGNTASYGGGGAYGMHGFDSVIESNVTFNSGGGIMCPNITGNITVSNCVIRGNSAPGYNAGGGGVYCYAGIGYDADILNCRIYDNMASNTGGGLSLSRAGYDPFSARIYGCLVYNNVAREGGGVYSRGTGYVVSACTVVSNLATLSGGGVSLSIGTITNSIVYSNLCVSYPARHNFYVETASYTDKVWYCCTPDVISPAQGNITGEPSFADFGTADFHLTANSPCVNAGTNEPWMPGTLDLDGRPRLDRFTGRVDMGAYECVLGGTLIRLH